MAINIALIDDQTLVREGVFGLLQLSSEVSVVAQGVDGSDAVTIATTFKPDVFLMDIQMPKMNGIEAVSALTAANINTPVIILTTFDDHELLIKAMKAGAKGYLLKDVSLERLIAAIQAVHKGETIVQPAITDTLIRGLHGHQNTFTALAQPPLISKKEVQVLNLVAAGYSNKEISAALNKSQGTIKNHISNVLSKLGVRDRTRAVLKAIELGII